MIFELIAYAIIGVVATIIAYWGVHSDYFIFRAVGAIIVGMLTLYGGIFIAGMVNWLKIWKKLKFMIVAIITGIIFAPLAHWGLFSNDFLFKILGGFIVVYYLVLLPLSFSIFLEDPKEKIDLDKKDSATNHNPTPQPKSAEQPKVATQPKQDTKPKSNAPPKPVEKKKQVEQPLLQSDRDYLLLLNKYFEDIGMACYEQSNLKHFRDITNRPIAEIRGDLNVIKARYKDLHGVSEPAQRSETAQEKLAVQSKLATSPKPTTQPKPATPPKSTTQPKPAAKPKQDTKPKQDEQPNPKSPIIVLCSLMVDLFVANLRNKNYCIDTIHGFLPAEAKKLKNDIDLDSFLATWLKESKLQTRIMQIENNDVTLYNAVSFQEGVALPISLLLKKNESYNKVHISLLMPNSQADLDEFLKLLQTPFALGDEELQQVVNMLNGLGELSNLQSFVNKYKQALDDVEKKENTNEQSNKNTGEEFYSFVSDMSDEDLLNCINCEYLNIKGSYALAPCMGEFGCFEFASVLLLWNYAKENFMSNQRTIGNLQIMLADVIGCAFFGMPAGEWSDKIDIVINDHEAILKYKEWSKVYLYLRNNFADVIHKMEFNEGNAPQEVYAEIYIGFTDLYNSTDKFSDVIDYYTSRGIHLGKDIKFRIDG